MEKEIKQKYLNQSEKEWEEESEAKDGLIAEARNIAMDEESGFKTHWEYVLMDIVEWTTRNMLINEIMEEFNKLESAKDISNLTQDLKKFILSKK